MCVRVDRRKHFECNVDNAVVQRLDLRVKRPGLLIRIPETLRLERRRFYWQGFARKPASTLTHMNEDPQRLYAMLPLRIKLRGDEDRVLRKKGSGKRNSLSGEIKARTRPSSVVIWSEVNRLITVNGGVPWFKKEPRVRILCPIPWEVLRRYVGVTP